MKVFLAQAAVYTPDVERSMPLGIMYLASYLRERYGCEVKLFDMQLRIKRVEPVIQAAREFGPELIGISGMSPDARAIQSLTQAIRREFPDVPLVIGGAHATNCPERTLDETDCDYLIPNEGELALGALVEHLRGERELQDVPSILYRRDGQTVQHEPAPYIEDLDSLPFPAFDLIDIEGYYKIQRCGVIFSHKRYAAMVTSRGCPYRCAYCHNILGKHNRVRSPENVVNEMQSLVREYGVGEFVIMDDMVNLYPKRINRIAELIIERKLDIKLHFPIGMRGDIMTEESVRLLKKAGMFRCMYAVETASPRLQKMIRKNNDLDKILHIIDYTQRQGVMVHGTFMLGFPTETEQEALATLELARRSRLHTAAFYRVIPYWGTDLYRMALDAGVEMPQEMEHYEFHKSDAINMSQMPDETLSRLRRQAYRSFYLRPSRLWRILQTLPNPLRLLPLLTLTWIRKALVW
ncbi:MAG: radical SAM protein [Candidatus Alcyoniella australis]|nr:radical SAM protein [Candidatus Alcyoniella australis]